jgi:hypothetical protein
MGIDVKWQEREANHSPSFTADIRKDGIYTFIPPYALIACAGTHFNFKLHRGNAWFAIL